MGQIWLVRHGESTANAGHRIPVNADAELTETGRQQAEAFSRALDRAPDLILATPYIRTQQTAEPTRRKYPKAPFDLVTLHEFNITPAEVYANTSLHERMPMVRDYWQRQDPDFVQGEGAESFRAACSRVSEEFSRIAARGNPFAVVFTHGRVMHLLRLMHAFPVDDLRERMALMEKSSRLAHVKNTEVLKFDVLEGGKTALNVHDLARFTAAMKSPSL